MDIDAQRSHTFAWRDSAATRAAARGLTGREFLDAMLRGELPPPPFPSLLGLTLVEVGERFVVFTFEPSDFMQNGIGLLHGGVAATVLDTAVGCACLTAVPRDKHSVTLDLSVRYFKPLTLASGVIRCEGRVINVGRTTVTTEGRLIDGNGRLCGHATSTLALIDATSHAASVR